MVHMGTDQQPLWRRAATHTLHTALLLKATIEERLHEETGLLLADNEALLNLAHTDEPIRMSDLADRLILSRGGTTKLIDRLESQGYVERTPAPDDRRATVLEITKSGRDIMTVARGVIDEQLKSIWATHISDEEARVLIEVMDRVIEHRPGT